MLNEGARFVSFQLLSACFGCHKVLHRRWLTTEKFQRYKTMKGEGEGEGEVAFFSAKRWDRRNRADLIESATPCHDAQVVGPYRNSNPLRLTVLAAMSEAGSAEGQRITPRRHNTFKGGCIPSKNNFRRKKNNKLRWPPSDINFKLLTLGVLSLIVVVAVVVNS